MAQHTAKTVLMAPVMRIAQIAALLTRIVRPAKGFAIVTRANFNAGDVGT